MSENKAVRRLLSLAAISIWIAGSGPWVRAAGEPLAQDNSGQANRPPSKALGRIEGVVTYHGRMPKINVADDTGRRRDLLHVDRKTRGLEYVVTYLVIDGPTEDGGQLPKEAQPPAVSAPVVVNQEEQTFVPHLIAVRVGEPVKFTNSDLSNHNVRGVSLDAKNRFNIYTGTGAEYVHRFRADPKNRPVLLSCDIHAWMQGWIYAFDHPYYAVTDAKGRFRITSVPSGKHRLVVRQPDGGYTSQHTVHVIASKTSRLEIRITRDQLKGL